MMNHYFAYYYYYYYFVIHFLISYNSYQEMYLFLTDSTEQDYYYTDILYHILL
jgi:hypothetical protein